MKIKVKNLGMLRQAEMELGDMTIICGLNNTAKTYTTYTIYGCFDYLKNELELAVSESKLKELVERGTAQIDLLEYEKTVLGQVQAGLKKYIPAIHRVLGAQEKLFLDASLMLDDLEFKSNKDIVDKKVKFGKEEAFVIQFSKLENESILSITLTLQEENLTKFPERIIKEEISDVLKTIFINGAIPKPFIASVERTGAAIFQRELDFNKSNLLDLLLQIEKREPDVNQKFFLRKYESNYPIPVRQNINFIRSIPEFLNQESFIQKEYPEILENFNHIIGGELRVVKGGIFFVPHSNRTLRLSLVESSSSVRAMVDIGFYLRYKAQKGDILMIDEPELNLHPKNQRLIARLFARLINIGIKVFITTHSDYFIKELNTLIMLHYPDDRVKKIAQEEGYIVQELIDPTKIKVYIAKEALVLVAGNKKKTSVHTLKQADIDKNYGIEVETFDTTIVEMNRIQDSIIWGS